MKNFKSSRPEELSLTAGTVLRLLEEDDWGWCRGTRKGETGWFPASHIMIIKDEPDCGKDDCDFDVSPQACLIVGLPQHLCFTVCRCIVWLSSVVFFPVCFLWSLALLAFPQEFDDSSGNEQSAQLHMVHSEPSRADLTAAHLVVADSNMRKCHVPCMISEQQWFGLGALGSGVGLSEEAMDRYCIDGNLHMQLNLLGDLCLSVII